MDLQGILWSVGPRTNWGGEASVLLEEEKGAGGLGRPHESGPFTGR